MDKEKQIASIKQRIIDEHRKHKDLDWAEIAARKIYNTHLVKEKCNLPVVSGSFSAVECKDLMYYGTLKDGTVKLDDGTKHLDYFLLNIFDMAKDSTRFNVKEAVKMFWDRIEALANYR